MMAGGSGFQTGMPEGAEGVITCMYDIKCSVRQDGRIMPGKARGSIRCWEAAGIRHQESGGKPAGTRYQQPGIRTCRRKKYDLHYR